MTSRERVLSAINHQRTDRAPADYEAYEGVTKRLIERLGVADYEGLLQALRIDMRRIECQSSLPNSTPDADGYVRTMWGVRQRSVGHGLVAAGESQGPGDMWGNLPKPDSAHDDRPEFIYPFNEDTTVDDVHEHLWPDPAALDFSNVKAECEKYRREYATYGAPWSPFFHEVGWMLGQEEFLIWMVTKPEVVQAIIDHIVDFGVAATRRCLEAADGQLDIAYFGNDFGTQRGTLISRDMWAQFIRQPLKRYYDVAHEYGCKVMQHSCGSVRDLIPWLIEDGVDILNPIQVSAEGMALAGLHRDFGGRITFYGAVDTQKTLPFGTPADVRKEVRSYLDLTRDHGGYILSGSQVLIDDIPLDNILAMYDENS